MDQKTIYGQSSESLVDHVCQKVGYIRAANDYGKDRCPMSLRKRKLLKGKARYPMIKWDGKVPQCEILCPILMGDLMCNESRQQWEG